MGDDIDSDFDSSPRPTKRCRTTAAKTGTAKGKSTRKNAPRSASRRRSSITSIATFDEDSENGFDPPKSPVVAKRTTRKKTPKTTTRKKSKARTATPGEESDDTANSRSAPGARRSKSRDYNVDEEGLAVPKKLKHHIAIVEDDFLQETFVSQAPPPSSNPWDIRGPIWIKQPPQPRPQEPELPKPPVPTVTSNHKTTMRPPPVPPSRTVATQPNLADRASWKRDPPMSTSAATALGPTAAPPVFKRPLQSDRPNTTLSAASTNTTQRLSTPALDLSNELADLPSDAFDSSQSSSISPTKSPQEAIHVSSQDVAVHTRKPNLVAPQNGLRQTTLFGGTVQKLGPTSQAKKHAWPLATQVQPPTHHKLDGEAAKTWVYPTNLGTIRDYQYNIVARGLFHNLLVALPTGLGKTFIAATVMLNWYRWTTDAQIVFVAPTRPLVAQQVDACFHIVGIPRSDTVMLTGTTSPGLRAEAWQSKRVFFMTPQTIMNDLKTGIADPKKIVLLVVDEAHRATGGYSYVELVKFLRRFNQSFRVLALTATPGSSVEAVQQVIDGLDISRVEIRTESSLDIRQYVHQRDVQVELFDFSDEQELVMDLFAKAVKPVMDKLAGQNAYWSRDPLTITAFGMNQSRQKWMAEAGKRAPMPVKGMVNTIFTVLASLGQPLQLLKFHGIRPFYSALLEFRNPIDSGQSKAKYAKQIVEDPNFVKLTNTVKTWVSNPDYLGHPKMEYLRSVVLNHLMDAGEGNAVAGAAPSATRIMIFAQWRNSVEDIVRVLKRNEPMVRPHAFIGQAASKGAEGMDQKKQLDVLEKFKKGTYNTLVATSIGEEGLDIGEIDLIICYDGNASPIRMLQRMGRTGRKRQGNIVMLLMKGKEEKDFEQAKDNYEKMQGMIASGSRFTFHDDRSPRILPKEIQPAVDKRVVEIPLENSQAELPEPKKGRGRAPKRPPKKFHMPDNVRTGFVRASRMDADDDEEESEEGQTLPKAKGRKATITTKRKAKPPQPSPEPEPAQLPFLNDVLLNKMQERELERKYQYIADTDGAQTVSAPRADRFPQSFREPLPTKRVKHGRVTTDIADMLQRVHDMDVAGVQRFKDNLHISDLEADVDNLLRSEPDDALPQAQSAGEESETALPSVRGRGSTRGRGRGGRARGAAGRGRGGRRGGRGRAGDDPDEAMEGGESSPEPTPAYMRLPTQGIDLGSDDTSGEDRDEGEPESELADFIIGSDQPVEVFSSSFPAAAEEHDPARRSFLLSQESLGAGTDGDLPDVEVLTARRREGTIEDEDGEVVEPVRKRGLRRIIEDSDEE